MFIRSPRANPRRVTSLEILLYYLGLDYRLEPAEHPLFIPGRCGKVVSAGVELGFIGEVRPEALEIKQITMPCAAFEINLDKIPALMKKG